MTNSRFTNLALAVTPSPVSVESGVLDQVESAFGDLSSVDQDVLTRRFGLGGRAPELLAQVAAGYPGKSTEWVRQVQLHAVGRLRVAIEKNPTGSAIPTLREEAAGARET